MPLSPSIAAGADALPGATPASDELPQGTVRRALWAICIVALLLRVTAMVVLRSWNHPGAMEHNGIATFLVAGNGFTFVDWGVLQPTSVQSPLFPFLLACFFWLFGTGSALAYASVMLINAVLGAISCALAYKVVRVLRGTATVGLLTAALVAVWPTQIYATTHVQAITFITCCVLAVIWLFYRSVDTGRLGPWLAYGLIGCLGALTEPVLLPFMALSGLLILGWPGLPGRLRVRNAAVLFLCAMTVLAPWTVRNYVVHKAIVPVKSTFWVNMWKGNNPHASGTDRLEMSDAQLAAIRGPLAAERAADPSYDGGRQYEMLTPEQQMMLYGKPEVEREKVFAQFTKGFMRENPGRYVELCGIRLWKTLWVEAGNTKARGTKQYLLYWTPRTILLLLTPVGLFVAWRRGWRMAIPLLVVGSGLLTFTLTITAARFALPYEPWQLALIAGLLFSPSAPYSGERGPKSADELPAH